MKRLFILFSVISLITYSNVIGQKKAHVDNKSVIETEEGGIIIFNNFNKLNLYFYIEYSGGIVSTTERHNLFTLGDINLQVLAIDKTPYEGKSNIETLENHANSEAEYLGDYFKVKFDCKTKKIKINDNSECLLWYYDMPESISKEVKSQLYISLIYEGYIVGVNTAQFAYQTFDQIFEFLETLIENTHFSEKRITLEYLCSNRK